MLRPRAPGSVPGLLATLLVMAVAGCSSGSERFDLPLVSTELEARSGHGLRPVSDASGTPDGVDIEDGISIDEAIAIALWRNADFQEALAALGLARADVIQAGLLSNPTFSVLFPVGTKQLEFAAMLPLEALLLRPRRVAAATLEAERLTAQLVEGGLDLIERVRQAFADLYLARTRRTVYVERARLDGEIASFQESRARNGDLSELEASLSRIEAMKSRQRSVSQDRVVSLQEQRLRDLLGLDEGMGELSFDTSPETFLPEESVDPDPETRLHGIDLSGRPEVRAAELSLEAARKRAGLARWEILGLSAGVDANEEGEHGFEIGPGLEGEIPLFNRNQDGRARAKAAVELAARHHLAVRRRIALEVGEAHLSWMLALEELHAWTRRIQPGLEEALRRARSAHAAGATSQLPVLRARGQILDARLHAAELIAAHYRAAARLERASGARCVEDFMGRGAEWELAP